MERVATVKAVNPMKHLDDHVKNEILYQLDNLDALGEMFYVRKTYSIYKSIAGSLRLMLTGSSGQPGMATLIPDCDLAVLLVDPASGPSSVGFIKCPARVQITSGNASTTLGAGVQLQNLHVAGGAVRAMIWDEFFDASKGTLPLNSWLDQKFLRQDKSIGWFIRTIGNKDGAAHFDPNDDVVALRRCGTIQSHMVAGIARSVSPQLRRQFAAAFPGYVRSEM
jgi:hypothetical protein